MESVESATIDPVTGTALPGQRRSSPGEEDRPDGLRQRLIEAAVSEINRTDSVTPANAAISAAAGTDEAALLHFFPAPDGVFLALVESIIADHDRRVNATIVRRRSLTESVRLALLASWDLIESRFDEHHAAMWLTLSGAVRQPLGGGEMRSLHAAFVATIERTLSSLEQVHGITWELPVRQLSRLVMATMYGFVLDYQYSRDARGVRDLIELFAYHLAQHGRRVAKNYPH